MEISEFKTDVKYSYATISNSLKHDTLITGYGLRKIPGVEFVVLHSIGQLSLCSFVLVERLPKDNLYKCIFNNYRKVSDGSEGTNADVNGGNESTGGSTKVNPGSKPKGKKGFVGLDVND